MTLIRLQKYLAEQGVGSRRACERMIERGEVSIDGEVAQVGQQVDPAAQKVAVKGVEIAAREAEKVYVVLNKPADVITTLKDTHGRRTVMHCLRGLEERVFPVGRLDQDVDGVLIFTNDGDLAYKLTHPKFMVDKTYQAWVKGEISQKALQCLRDGVPLDDGMSAPARAKLLKSRKNASLVELIIYEGRKHEVKRMFNAVGHPVDKLRRIAFADIRATGLRSGEWRRLTEAEVESLRKSIVLQPEKT